MYIFTPKRMRLTTLAVVLVAGSIIGSGCDMGRVITTVRQTQQQIQQQAQQSSQRAAQRPTDDVAARRYIAGLTPIKSGPGILVCEPMAVSSDASTTDFGAGCARWLHLTVGGHGELGKTPLWSAVDNARREMSEANLRLSPAQAAKLGRKLGVTHVATGEIKGNAARCTFTYRLWKLPEQKAAGLPLTVTGSQNELLARLPQLARQLTAQLGVPSPRVPATVGATSADIIFLGQMPWQATQPVPTVGAQRLKTLSRRLPLAGVLYQNSDNIKDDLSWAPVVRQLIALAPDNTLVISDIARLGARMLAPHRATVERAVKQYPGNYLLAAADTYRHRVNHNRVGERRAAERAVQCAPHNSLAWAELALTISHQTEDVRRARPSNLLTAAEWVVLDKLYAQGYQVGKQAVALDASNAAAWFQLSNAATFYGDSTTADTALQKALAIDPDNTRYLDWGLQIYQPKWYSNRTQLVKLVDKITADATLFAELFEPVVEALENSGMGRQAKDLYARGIKDFQAAASANPKDVAAHNSVAYILWRRHRYDEAIPYYRAVVQLNPRNAEAHYQLGWILHYQKRTYREAEELYRKAIALRPDYAEAINSLANITYYVRRDAAEAERLYRRAIALKWNGLFHAELARLLADQGRRDEAVAAANRAIALGYRDSSNPIWAQLDIKP